MAPFRRHVNYGNVVATLALFLALGGGAYAAVKLPKNSVTSVQVKNGSLTAKDFKKGQLKGKTGPAGPAGANHIRIIDCVRVSARGGGRFQRWRR